MRRAAKTDNSSGPIVEAIEAEGWEVFDVRLPCDKICWHPVLDVLQWLEIKTIHDGRRKPLVDKRQETQRKFLSWTACPIVTTPEEALEALRKHYPTAMASEQLIADARRMKADFEKAWKQRPAA